MAFQLHDPVKIEQKPPNPPLQGIVAYVGEVSFADGDDWIGIRLVGSSVGRGKNDGTVKGKQYIPNCPENGGVFVRSSSSAVQKWTMTKLEELRVKRELKGVTTTASTSSAASVSSVGSRSRTPRSSTHSASSSKNGDNDDDDSTVASVGSTRSSASMRSSASNRSRLDEIRNRRLELQSQRKNKLSMKSPPPKNIIAAKTTAGSVAASASVGEKKRVSSSSSSSRDAASGSASASTSEVKTPVRSSKSATSASGAKTPTRKPPTSKQGPMSPSPSATPVRSTSSRRIPSSSSAEVTQLKEKIQSLTEQLNEKDQALSEQASRLEGVSSTDHELRSKITTLTKELYQKEEDAKKLQDSLRIAEETAHNAKLFAQEAQAATEAARRDAEEVINAAAAVKNEVEDNDKIISNEEVTKLEEELTRLKEEYADMGAQNEILGREKMALEDNLVTTQRQNSSLRQELERERETYAETIQSYRNEVSEARSQASTFEKELMQNTEKAALRDDNNAAHYKERAKLQAEVLSWQRKVKEMEKEKVENDHALEDLALDKEQLLEKIETLEDNYEELKIDAESAQIELDEFRMELEEAKERAEKAEAALSLGEAGGGFSKDEGTTAEKDEIVQALSIQNARLREAILRLREQTSLEKMEMSRQLRVVKKDAETIQSLNGEVTKLAASEKILKEEVKELKEMVDQGSAFEEMVEDLSERVLAVEDNNISLQGTIRELEEAGELSAEMEEAQADEIKVLMKEVQSRDTVVFNMEEAIKMQRRRELDFQRTVGNYRTTIETLQKEKESLLTELGGREGVKKDALVASQKALAQAAQSVADAAAARKKEATASFHLIDAQVKSHLAERLEDFLPQNIASSEISAVKGELLLSKIAMKASLSLSSVGEIFERSLKTARDILNHDISVPVDSGNIAISSALAQEIGVVLHQTKFTQLAIDLSSDCIRLLSVGQWPDLISSSASVDLGMFILHSVSVLDSAISEQLMLLKKEGCLSPHQSNLNILTQAITSTRAALMDAVDDDGNQIIPSDWSPPCLDVFRSISSSKFHCLGVAAVISSIVSDGSGALDVLGVKAVSTLATKMDKLCKELLAASSSLSGIDITDTEVVRGISAISPALCSASSDLFACTEAVFSSREIESKSLVELDAKVDAATHAAAKLISLLRAYRVEGVSGLCLSPETNDPWSGVIEISRKIHGMIGEADDLNYVVRTRNLEEQLVVAVENDAKLAIAQSKVKSLEKNLATRSKEIAIQNSRLQELESLLSQTTMKSSSPQKPPMQVEEVSELKEEIRVLNEAMEVMQSQVEEYEKEIRSLKDQKSKSRRAPGPVRKSANLDADFTLSNLGIGAPQKVHRVQESAAKSLSLDSALFRPALRSALSDASMWKSKVISEKLLELPPLSVSMHNNLDLVLRRNQLSLACADLRRNKACVEVIKLSKSGRLESQSSIRSQMMAEREKTRAASMRLQKIVHFPVSAQVA